MKHKIITISIIGILLLIGGYYFNTRPAPSAWPVGISLPAEVSLDTEETVVSVRQPPADWREYRTEHYGFSLFYPKTVTVQEFDEGGGASTIVFQNPEEGIGFQIFIVPFSGNQITDERFRQDVPSGVRKELREVSVGGANAASFYSIDTLLGETAEVWFIKNGFLYEVTAPRSLAEWLSEIIKTWLFL